MIVPNSAAIQPPHSHDDCRIHATVEARKQRLLELHRCYRCLSTGHISSACTKARKCRHCNRADHHNTAICAQRRPAGGSQHQQSSHRTDQSGTTPVKPVSSSVASCQHLHSLPVPVGQVRLMTAIAHVRSCSGTSMPVRILLDSGSQPTFVSTAVAEHLKLTTTRQEHLMVSTFAGKQPFHLKTNIVKFDLQLRDGSYFAMEANVLPKITDRSHSAQPYLTGRLRYSPVHCW